MKIGRKQQYIFSYKDKSFAFFHFILQCSFVFYSHLIMALNTGQICTINKYRYCLIAQFQEPKNLEAPNCCYYYASSVKQVKWIHPTYFCQPWLDIKENVNAKKSQFKTYLSSVNPPRNTVASKIL